MTLNEDHSTHRSFGHASQNSTSSEGENQRDSKRLTPQEQLTAIECSSAKVEGILSALNSLELEAERDRHFAYELIEEALYHTAKIRSHY